MGVFIAGHTHRIEPRVTDEGMPNLDQKQNVALHARFEMQNTVSTTIARFAIAHIPWLL